MIAAVMFSFAGCKTSQEYPVDTTLSVQDIHWNETGSSENEPAIYSPVETGDIVYDYMDCEIEVKSVSEDSVVLDIDGCLVEPNSDGSINLRADPLEQIELEAGESITLVSQTMDAGIRIVITYEG